MSVKRWILAAAAACLVLTGCLDRSYSSVEPHENRYWESTAEDILRAESYQDFVNTILLLVEQHEETGIIRLYLTDVDYATAFAMVKDACTEVRLETAVGSYLLEKLDYDMEELRNSYYEVTLLPTYRRTQEDLDSIVETASSSAVYELLVTAWENQEPKLTVRYAHPAEEQDVLVDNILLLQTELVTGTAAQTPGENVGETAPETETPEITPWEIYFYPPEGEGTIVEIFLQPQQ